MRRTSYRRGLAFPVFTLLETPATATRTIPSLIGAGGKELATRTLHGSPEREILQHHHRGMLSGFECGAWRVERRRSTELYKQVNQLVCRKTLETVMAEKEVSCDSHARLGTRLANIRASRLLTRIFTWRRGGGAMGFHLTSR